MMTEVQAALTHTYWISGGSGAGKSTIARHLALRHNMLVYSTDEKMRDHGERCTPEESPRIQQFAKMSMDERWVQRTPIEMLETFHWFQGEGFRYIIDDLLKLPNKQKIVVEGFRLLPHLVKSAIAYPLQAIWLIPTPEFREFAFGTRGSMWDIPNKTSHPEKALRNLLVRDAMFTDRLKQEAEAEGYVTILVDGSRSEEQLTMAVEQHFKL